MDFKRHNLVEITDRGREWAFWQIQKSKAYNNHQIEQVRELIVEGIQSRKIPGIIRRNEELPIERMIPVGFASPCLNNERRLRIPAFVPEEEIVKIITPYEVINMKNTGRTECLLALDNCKKIAAENGIRLGVWGSACLEIYTGLPYTHPCSDLDLLVGPASYSNIKNFYLALESLRSRYACKIDPELDLPSGYGVKVMELFLETEDVLGKGLVDVKLIPKQEIWGLIGGEN